MQDFKIGDRVREIATGDEGVVVEYTEPTFSDLSKRINVFWQTGDCKGSPLSISKRGVQKIEPNPVSSVQQAIDFLITQGYTVSLSR